MNVLLAILRRDLRRTRRAPLTTILLLVLPLALGALMAAAFGSGPPQVRLLLSWEDDSTLGELLGGAVERIPEDRIQVTRVDSSAGLARLEAGDASAWLHVPPRFLADVADGEETSLRLVKSSREQIMPQVIEEGALILADGLSQASVLLGEPIGRIRDMSTTEEAPEREDVAAVALLVNDVMAQSGRYLFPPAVGLENATAEGAEGGGATRGRVFLFVIPGLAVMALLYIADSTMRDILQEKASGTLSLALAAPIGPGHLVLGKVLATVVLGLISLGIVIPFAIPFLESPVNLPAFLAISIAFCLAAGGFAAITYGLARNERQGGVVGNVVMLVMAFLGGSYLPLSSLPEGLRRLSPFTLNFWAVEGYGRVIREGAGLAAVATNIGVLLALALLLGGIGSMLLRNRVARGLR